jgi:ABC-2 type transport system permease protein
MQYKANFALLALGQFLGSFATFIGVYFMLSIINVVDGFTYGQVLLCFATMNLAFSITEIFTKNFQNIPRLIGNGQFDRSLVRPRGILFQTVASRVDFCRFGRTLQAVVVFVYAIPNSGVIWSLDKIFTLFLMVVCGSLVFSALFLMGASFAFFATQGLDFMNVFTFGGREHGSYPFSIYGKEVLTFLTFVIPLALFQYWPLLYLLDMKRSALYMLAPLFGLLILVPGYAIFRFGLRHYKSTGS